MSHRMALAVFLAAASLYHNAFAQSAIDFGRWEYESNCAACHGIEGNGDGTFGAMLKKAPSDLTILSKMNGGAFPFEHVYRIIDGRQEVIGHGSREMPVWGYDYQMEGTRKHLVDIPPYDIEADIRLRIYALIDCLNRLQVK